METVIDCMSLEEMKWSISIAEKEEEDQECGDVIFLIVMVYCRASTSTLALLTQVFDCVCDVSCLYWTAQLPTGRLSSAVIYFTLESEANEDPPEFTLTCQSRGGPVTEVEWRRNRLRVEEDSSHMTSQIIVDTSSNTVYNNTLRVRGRETGSYRCSVSNNRHNYVKGTSSTGTSAIRFLFSELTWSTVNGIHISFLLISVPLKPTSLNATYKTPTSISLEWTFSIKLNFDYSYVVYYQSRDGISHSVAFTTDSREDHTHEPTGLPVGGIHSISLVALIHLPSPVVGPVTPGKYIIKPIISQLSGYSVVEAPVVVVSGEGSGEVGTSYSLTCRVTLPLGVAGVSPNIQWNRPNMPYTPASTPDSANSRQFHTTLELNPLQSTDAGEYICQANYSLGGYTSPLVRDSLTLEVISKSLFDSVQFIFRQTNTRCLSEE